MPSNSSLPAVIGIILILAAVAVAVLVVLFLKAQFSRQANLKTYNLTPPQASPNPPSEVERQLDGRAQDSMSASTSGGILVAPKPDDESTPKASAKLYARRTLTTAEGRFYDFLRGIVKDQYVIQTKVPLRDLFHIYGWLEKELFTMHNRGHIDFLLLEPITKQPVLAIELDYTSHDTPKGRDADRRKEELLKRANLPLRRIRVGKLWGVKEQQVIREALPPHLSFPQGS